MRTQEKVIRRIF